MVVLVSLVKTREIKLNKLRILPSRILLLTGMSSFFSGMPASVCRHTLAVTEKKQLTKGFFFFLLQKVICLLVLSLLHALENLVVRLLKYTK